MTETTYYEDIPVPDTLTEEDIDYLEEIYADRCREEDFEESYETEILMTSIGYVELWWDGTVTSFGETKYICGQD